MYVTECFNNGVLSHSDLDFVNTNTIHDTQVFINPILIMRKAKYESSGLFYDMRNAIDDFSVHLLIAQEEGNINELARLTQYAHEPNYLRIGYSKSRYGHGNSSEGLRKKLVELEDLISLEISAESLIMLPVLLKDFGADGLSDLTGNIVARQLISFTNQISMSLNLELGDLTIFKIPFWNTTLHRWDEYRGQGLIVEGRPLILIPKELVSSDSRNAKSDFFKSQIIKVKQAEEKEKHDRKMTQHEVKEKHYSQKSRLEYIFEKVREDSSAADAFTNSQMIDSDIFLSKDEKLDRITGINR